MDPHQLTTLPTQLGFLSLHQTITLQRKREINYLKLDDLAFTLTIGKKREAIQKRLLNFGIVLYW